MLKLSLLLFPSGSRVSEEEHVNMLCYFLDYTVHLSVRFSHTLASNCVMFS